MVVRGMHNGKCYVMACDKYGIPHTQPSHQQLCLSWRLHLLRKDHAADACLMLAGGPLPLQSCGHTGPLPALSQGHLQQACRLQVQPWAVAASGTAVP